MPSDTVTVTVRELDILIRAARQAESRLSDRIDRNRRRTGSDDCHRWQLALRSAIIATRERLQPMVSGEVAAAVEAELQAAP